VLGLNARGIYRLPPRHVGPAALVGDYFAAVTAQDPALLRTLFAPDGVLDVDGDVRRGHQEVLSYYTDRTFVFEDFRPSPGPLHVDGTTVTVDIDVHLGGADRSVRDVFETDGSHITAVRVRGFADVLRAAAAR
jgi:ketosteroid isomerase-like protein